jgi:hypothetical protein
VEGCTAGDGAAATPGVARSPRTGLDAAAAVFAGHGTAGVPPACAGRGTTGVARVSGATCGGRKTDTASTGADDVAGPSRRSGGVTPAP